MGRFGNENEKIELTEGLRSLADYGVVAVGKQSALVRPAAADVSCPNLFRG
jgi:hypothetical protein